MQPDGAHHAAQVDFRVRLTARGFNSCQGNADLGCPERHRE
jgi:hypothetical protein